MRRNKKGRERESQGDPTKHTIWVSNSDVEGELISSSTVCGPTCKLASICELHRADLQGGYGEDHTPFFKCLRVDKDPPVPGPILELRLLSVPGDVQWRNAVGCAGEEDGVALGNG